MRLGAGPGGYIDKLSPEKKMDTVSIFAIGCLILALAAGFAGAVLGSHQLVLGG